MCNLAVINGAGRITNANRTRSNDTRHVVDDVIMRIVAQLVVAILIDINSTIAGLASTIQVRSHLIVKHQIPYKHSLAILVYRSERHILHIRHQSFTQVTSVIPGSDTGFREYQFLVRTLVVNISQLAVVAAIIMISSTYNQL